jgi:hydroxymethylglutaryl-CoA lyase
MDRAREVALAARRDGVPVRAHLSVAWHCPYEGATDRQVVVRLVDELLCAGAWQVSLGDTIGSATPNEVAELLDDNLARVPTAALALHMHDTRGTALANVLTGLTMGITTIDASAGGLGGCPYAPGAAGNLATEDLLYMLHGMGIETSVSLPEVARAAARMYRALAATPWSTGAG